MLATDHKANTGKSFSKTATGFREMHLNTPERNKTIVIRKIIMYAYNNEGYLP